MSDTNTTEVPSLNINDLNVIKEIIDIASSRGAFKPNEMVAVGQTYNKLVAFLQQISAQQEQAVQPQREATAQQVNEDVTNG